MSDEAEPLIFIGDIHGNTSGLLNTLLDSNFITRDQVGLVNRLIALVCPEPNQEQIVEFLEASERLIFPTHEHLCLLGDEFADRGPNDIFTLIIIYKLLTNNCISHYLVSNHSSVMIAALERNIYNFDDFCRLIQELYRMPLEQSYPAFQSFGNFLKTMQMLQFASNLHPQLNTLLGNIQMMFESIIMRMKLADLIIKQNDYFFCSHAPITMEILQIITTLLYANNFIIFDELNSIEDLITICLTINTLMNGHHQHPYLTHKKNFLTRMFTQDCSPDASIYEENTLLIHLKLLYINQSIGPNTGVFTNSQLITMVHGHYGEPRSSTNFNYADLSSPLMPVVCVNTSPLHPLPSPAYWIAGNISVITPSLHAIAAKPCAHTQRPSL